MKTIKNLMEGASLSRKLSSDETANFKAVATELDNIVSALSKWVESDDDNEGTDTDTLAHLLSNLASQLRGEWNEEIKFSFNK